MEIHNNCKVKRERWGSLIYNVLSGIPNARQLSQSEEAVLSLYMSTGVSIVGFSDEQKAKEGMFKGAIKFCKDPVKATAEVRALVLKDIEKL